MKKKKYTPTKTGKSVYEIITERILTSLEAGVVPWHQPWKGKARKGPRNLVTGHGYTGVNIWLTSTAGFEDERWITWKQLQTIGGRVKKGEHATPIVFWLVKDDPKKVDPSTGERKKYFSARYYRVFNVEQCEIPSEWLQEEEPKEEFEPLEEAERIAKGYQGKPKVIHGFGRACYWPNKDEINMPDKGQFESPEAYYSVLFHEMSHSTGHISRLNRNGVDGTHHFGDSVYSKEELIAEMGAAFLCGHAGIENQVESSAAYLKSWIDALRGDSKLLIHASAAAQKASDLILGKKKEGKSQ